MTAPASGSARSNTRISSPRATEAYVRTAPLDEWDAIALNYTSGTTGDPKGVVYHHRGAHPARARQCRHRRHGPASRLSLDAADVPLQRLVLSLVDQRQGGRACLPAPGARQADVRR